MRPSNPPVPIEALLAHEAWVRRLAVQLTSSASAADDLAQDTWVEALERPPSHAGNLRGWLARVTRSKALRDVRDRQRQRRREQVAARPEDVPAADALVGRAETQRDVVDAVLALDEPYRRTLLLRFYEGLPPRRVADEMGVPVETVRTRTRRGLARVRELLRGKYASDWRAALLPLAAGLRPGETTMASTTTTFTAAAAALVLGVLGLTYASGVFDGRAVAGAAGGDFAAAPAPVLRENEPPFADHDEDESAPSTPGDGATDPSSPDRKTAPAGGSGTPPGQVLGGSSALPPPAFPVSGPPGGTVEDHDETPVSVTFDVANRKLDELVDQIAADTGATIELRGDAAKDASNIPVTLKLTDHPLESTLAVLARICGCTYARDGETHVIE